MIKTYRRRGTVQAVKWEGDPAELDGLIADGDLIRTVIEHGDYALLTEDRQAELMTAAEFEATFEPVPDDRLTVIEQPDGSAHWHRQDAGNNEIISHGETYTRVEDAVTGALRANPDLTSGQIVREKVTDSDESLVCLMSGEDCERAARGMPACEGECLCLPTGGDDR